MMLSDFEPTDLDGNYSAKQKEELFSKMKALTPI